jgi:AraC-like DNA-binding protein
VAAELGFSAASSLSRAFKQRFGVAPRAWLAAQQQPETL